MPGSTGSFPSDGLHDTRGCLVRMAGKIGIPGLYVTEDPGAVDAATKMGR